MRKKMRFKPISNTLETTSKPTMNVGIRKEPENEGNSQSTLLIPASVSVMASLPMAIKLHEH